MGIVEFPVPTASDPITVREQDLNDAIQRLLVTVAEQAVGMKLMAELLADHEARLRKLELERRKRDRSASKLVDMNGKRIG